MTPFLVCCGVASPGLAGSDGTDSYDDIHRPAVRFALAALDTHSDRPDVVKNALFCLANAVQAQHPTANSPKAMLAAAASAEAHFGVGSVAHAALALVTAVLLRLRDGPGVSRNPDLCEWAGLLAAKAMWRNVNGGIIHVAAAQALEVCAGAFAVSQKLPPKPRIGGGRPRGGSGPGSSPMPVHVLPKVVEDLLWHTVEDERAALQRMQLLSDLAHSRPGLRRALRTLLPVACAAACHHHPGNPDVAAAAATVLVGLAGSDRGGDLPPLYTHVWWAIRLTREHASVPAVVLPCLAFLAAVGPVGRDHGHGRKHTMRHAMDASLAALATHGHRYAVVRQALLCLAHAGPGAAGGVADPLLAEAVPPVVSAWDVHQGSEEVTYAALVLLSRQLRRTRAAPGAPRPATPRAPAPPPPMELGAALRLRVGVLAATAARLHSNNASLRVLADAVADAVADPVGAPSAL
jgi:hypothetical protein